jgi:hypothetical protein
MFAPSNPRLVPVRFCVKCFADDRSSSLSGSGSIVNDHCLNCGSGGTIASLQVWAVDSIREQASWVGKRYYPNDEDRQLNEELRALRREIGNYPGRSAEPSSTPGQWDLIQVLENGSTRRTSIVADSAEDALKKGADYLPWVKNPKI